MAAAGTKLHSLVHGVLCVNKPAGISSHTVVGKVRRLFNTRKVGHAGTLDPLATGLLLVCVGKATKISSYIMGQDKVYTCDVVLGTATTTYDAEGQVTSTSQKVVAQEELEQALQHFQGDLLQRPPLYSAIKKDGKKLYEYARKGQQVDVPSRPVRIDALDCLQFQYPRLTLRIACSKGTYIRSIAHDLGQALGVGGHAQHIHREKSGAFSLAQAVDWQVIEDQNVDQAIGQLITPMQALSFMPCVQLDADQVRAMKCGQGYNQCVDVPTGAFFVFAFNGKAVALAQSQDEGSHPKVMRVL
jgi:tRNA pseudouridine55 synthase